MSREKRCIDRGLGVLLAAVIGAAAVESVQAKAPGDLAETEGFLSHPNRLNRKG